MAAMVGAGSSQSQESGIPQICHGGSGIKAMQLLSQMHKKGSEVEKLGLKLALKWAIGNMFWQ